MSSHSIILSYVLFILSCTTSEVWICVHSIFIILLLRYKYSASLQRQHNWCQLPLHIAHRPSRANGGAPVLAGVNNFRLTLVPPTPNPVHPYHPSHVGSNQPMHKTMCLHPVDTIQSNPADTIQPIHPIQSSDMIQPMIRSIGQSKKATKPKIQFKNQDPSSFASLPHHRVIPHILMMPPHLIFYPPHRPLPPDICSLPLLLHLLLPSLLRI